MVPNLVTNLDTCIPSALDMLGGSFALLYYSHIPTLVIALLFAFFVLHRGQKEALQKIFFFLALLFAAWSILDLVTWLSSDTRKIMFAWSLTTLVEALLYLVSLYFIYVYIKKEDVSLKYKLFFGLLLLPLILMIPTEFNLEEFYAGECYAFESKYSAYYKYFIEIVCSSVIVIFSLLNIRKAPSDFKRQLIILLVGVLLFLLSFFVAVFLSGYLVDNGMIHGYSIEVYGLFGMTIFMGFLAYLIVQYKVFNIKIFAAQALVVALILLIGSQFFFIRNNTNRILTTVTFILVSSFGYILVKNIKLEIRRKEQLQRITEELAVANDNLRKLDNAKSEFISIASHQLRTPLTAIKGFISLLLEGSYGKVNKNHREVLNKVYLSNERLINLVEDLLNLSRIESGRMQYEYEKVSLEGVCREIYDTFAIRAREKNLKLELILPEEKFPQVETDRKKIREVVSNVIDNAIKYTLEGGVAISLYQKEGFVGVKVKDTGVGITKEDMSILFQKFSRGKDISRINTGGTGLGLHVGRSMMEAMGGFVRAESEGKSKGATFFIEVPVERG